MLLAGLLLWEIAARSGWISGLFFPAPSIILFTLGEMALSGKLWSALNITLYRLGMGLILGAGSGLLLGWLMGANRAARVTLDPIVAALHPLPKLALFPIILVLLGIGEASKIALVAMASFFPLVINTLAGVQQIDHTYWEAAANFGARRGALLRRVILPGSLPMVMVGLRLALNSGLVVTIAVEMLSAREGLGAMIWLAWQTLRTEELYAVLVIIGVIGLLGNAVLTFISGRLVPWQPRERNNV